MRPAKTTAPPETAFTTIITIGFFRVEVVLMVFIEISASFVAGLLESGIRPTPRCLPGITVVHATKTVGFPGPAAAVKTVPVILVVSSFTGITILETVGKTPGTICAFKTV